MEEEEAVSNAAGATDDATGDDAAAAGADGGEDVEEEEEDDEDDKVLISQESGDALLGEDLVEMWNEVHNPLFQDQDVGVRYLTFKRIKRTKGRVEATPMDGLPQVNTNDPPPDSREDGAEVGVRATWASDLPMVTAFTVRYPGVVRDPRALIESPNRGVGPANLLPNPLRGEFRYISHQLVSSKTSSRDTVIRFEASRDAALHLQRLIGDRGGKIRVGAIHTIIQQKGKDVGPDTPLNFYQQS